MSIKRTIEIMPQRSLTVPPRGRALSIPTPPEMASVPAPISTPLTIWGAKRRANYYDALTGMTNAHSGYLRARGELAKSFIVATRAANEVAELPEICETDTEVRRSLRERDILNARREVEEARYGLCATLGEVDRIRRPLRKKAVASNGAAIDALMKAKIDREALGEDTSELDATLLFLQRAQP
jgi:hypothetical protein